MKNWLKIFGLSFFSDNLAIQSAKRGFAGVAVALVMSFMFFLFGYYGADVAPFSVRYDNAESYKEFIESAFGTGGAELSIKDQTAQSDKIINTYKDQSGYAKNGYNLIVDTRSSHTLIEFEQVAVNGESRISYEEYRALSEGDKKQYKLELICTDKELEITAEYVKLIEEFLKTDQAAQKDFEALDGNAEDYNEQLYYLYVKYYYTSVNSVLRGAKAPVLRDYYYRQFISNGNSSYLYIFDNILAGSFNTDGGIPVVFGGYFEKVSDGKITDMHAFIKEIYYASAGYTFTSYFLSTVSQLPMLIFIPLIIALLMWGIGKAVKDGWEKTYSGCFKIVNSFVWFSAFTTAILTFACSWFASTKTLYALMPVIFAAILIIRTAVLCISGTVKNRKADADNLQKNLNDIFGGEL